MIDQQVRDITQRLLEAEFRLRDEALQNDTRAIKERLSARGMLSSGFTVSQINDLARREYRARTNIAWDKLQRVLSDTGVAVTPELAGDLLSWIEGHIEAQFQALGRFLSHAFTGVGMGGGVGPLQDEAAALKQEFRARADLLVLSLSKRAASAPASSVMNFYGTVGAVQTGALASASVSLQLAQADLASLSEAINRVADEIGAAADLQSDAVGAVQEILLDLKDEMKKQKPNSIRLRHLAMGVATTIQTSASLRPSYEVLKAALLPLGVVLP